MQQKITWHHEQILGRWFHIEAFSLANPEQQHDPFDLQEAETVRFW